MTKHSNNVLIVVCCTIILCGILFCLRFLPDKSQSDFLENKESASVSLLNKPIEKIEKIIINNSYGQYSFIKIKDNKLEIEDLKNYPRHESNYEELSSIISNLTADIKVNIDDNTLLETYGLDKPVAQIEILYNNPESKDMKLLIGNQAPSNLGYYFKIENNPDIYVVQNNNIEPFLKSKLDYISLVLTSPSSIDETMKNLEYIEINNIASGKIKIVPSKSTNENKKIDSYTIIEPTNKSFTDEDLGIINSMETMYADKVEMVNPTDGDIKKYKLDNPMHILTLKYNNKNPIIIKASPSENEDEYFLMVEGSKLIYLISKDSLRWINFPLKDAIN